MAVCFSAAATSILTAVNALFTSSNSTASTAKKYFAMGEVDFDPKIYVLAQCVPVLTVAQCQGSLADLQQKKTKLEHQTPVDSILCGVVQPEVQHAAILRGPVHAAARGTTGTMAMPPSGNLETGAGKKRSSAAGISVGIACSLVLILILSVFAFIRFKRRIKAIEQDNPFKKISRAQCIIFDLPALQETTENFSQRNKLGEGGCGVVYKGILPDGQEIAVKKLLGRAGHGLPQLHNEVMLLAELQHKNLVKITVVLLSQG